MAWVTGQRGYKRTLLENSVDAYVLALETINRISIQHRIESFLLLICNSWELLLKAKIIQDTGQRNAIYSREKSKSTKGRVKVRRTLPLRVCAATVFPNESDPIRRNLEFVTDLRDDACHFCISEIPMNIMALFQACVLNYHGKLNEWFGISLQDVVPTGMMTIVFDASPDRFRDEVADLKKRGNASTIEYLLDKQKEVEKEYRDLDHDVAYAIVIKHEFHLVRKPGYSEVTFSAGDSGAAVTPIHIAKRSDESHPYICKEVVERLNDAIQSGIQLTQHDIVAVVAAHRTNTRSEFFFQARVKNAPKQYSQKFIDWIIERYRQDPNFFVEARLRYRDLQRQRSTR